MSSKYITIIEDDLDGSEGAETVQFGLDGQVYEIDLNEEHRAEFRKTLEKYASVARKADMAHQVRKGNRRGTARTGKRAGTTGTSRPATSGKGAEQAEKPDIREWAKANGYIVGDRGRVPKLVRENYEAAMREAG